jgi:hypothetical protein
MTPRLLLILATTLLVGSACTVSSPSPEPTQSHAAATPTASATTAACSPIDLRDPAGARVDLTGTWRVPGGGPVYYLYQDGDCFWYAGGFAASDGTQEWGPLGLYTIVFEGTLKSNFTIPGRWAVVRMGGTSFSGNAWHDKVWTITFEPEGADLNIVLTSSPDEPGAVSATHLQKVSDEVVTP